jgi:excisionase family DNA binding protein
MNVAASVRIMTNREDHHDAPVNLTPREAAKALGVSIRTLYRWEDDGLISPRRTPGGHRRYTLADIDALLGRSA